MIWRYIKGTNKMYQVSNAGLVKSVKRNLLLSLCSDRDGYLLCGIYVDGIRINKRVHRLVAEAFIGNPLCKSQVNHKNGIKSDNRLENLEWCTSSENIRHSFDKGLSSQKGEKHAQSKLNQLQVRVIRKLRGDMKQKEIGRLFGISFKTVSNIQLDNRWNHL